MNITNLKVYDLEDSIVASGLPMLAEYEEQTFDNQAELLFYSESKVVRENPHFKRACKLAANPAGSGHNNFLSGIVVSMNITATVKWWEQFQRYHFKQIVSSQSTMHRLRKMVSEGKISFNPLTNPDIVNAFVQLAKNKNISDEELAYSCPMGLELTARITINYLQLKTMYNQRKNHKLAEWRQFCADIRTLPYAAEFITGEKEDEQE